MGYSKCDLSLGRKAASLEENDLLIEKERHVYSDEFIGLTKDYYLKL